MDIWVIGRSFPLPNNQFKGSFEWEQAKLLASRGHRVSYLACVFHPFKKIKKWGFTTWQEETVNVCCYSRFFLPERLKLSCAPLRKNGWRLLLSKAEEQVGLPEVIHVHYPGLICQPEVLEMYQARGVRIVCTEHWSRVLLKTLCPHELSRLQWYMEHADAVAAVGAPLGKAMQELTGCPRELAIIPNVLNPLFRPAPSQTENGVFRFVTLGRLVALRQYDQVIRSFDRLFHGRRDVTLTLIGGGEKHPHLKALIEKLQAQDNIFLTGLCTPELCAALLADAHCLVCYSRYETFGVPVIEAWASGIPVIAPRHMGFLEGAVGEQLGIPVDSDDPQSLQEAMKQMQSGQREFDPAFLSRYAQSHYSQAVISQKLLALYSKHMKKAP